MRTQPCVLSLTFTKLIQEEYFIGDPLAAIHSFFGLNLCTCLQLLVPLCFLFLIYVENHRVKRKGIREVKEERERRDKREYEKRYSSMYKIDLLALACNVEN